MHSEKDIFYEWEAQNLIDQDVHVSSTPLDVLEITSNQGAVSPEVAKHVLQPDEFRSWLLQGAKRIAPIGLSTITSSLTLVIAGCDRKRPTLPSSATPMGVGFPTASARTWNFPINEEDYKLLRRNFNLHGATTSIFPMNTWSASGASFHVFDTLDPCEPQSEIAEAALQSLGINMRIPGGDLVGMNAVLSLSHSPATRTTQALLLCKTWRQATYIVDSLVQLAPVASHPGTLPIILCNIFFSALLRKISLTWHDVFEIEHESGLTGITTNEEKPIGGCDDPNISRRAIQAVQMATAFETYVLRGTRIICNIEGFLSRYSRNSPQKDAASVGKEARVLTEYAKFSVERAGDLQYQIGHLLSRARLQLEAINNHLAHRGNQINTMIGSETRDDSSSMKTVAILTMTFLPATFLSAYFATPGASSSKPSQSLYWAVTLPITFLVIGAWFTWTHVIKRARQTSSTAVIS